MQNDSRGLTRRKLLQGAGAAAGLIGMGAMSGPARAQSSSSGSLTVLASGDMLPYYEYLKGEFAKDHPDVAVEIQQIIQGAIILAAVLLQRRG